MNDGDAARLKLVQDCWPELVSDFTEAELRKWVSEVAAHQDARVAEGALKNTLKDLFLAFACLRGNSRAISIFERLYITNVPSYLSKVERDPSVLSEIAQRVREKALVAHGERPAALSQYVGAGALGAWVRVVALREHGQWLRGKREQLLALPDAELPAPELSPEAMAVRARCLPMLRTAFEQSIAKLTAREKTLLRMHYTDGMTLEAIANVYAVNKATVSRWLASAREQVLKATTQQLTEKDGTFAKDGATLFSVLTSQLELSLSGLLRLDQSTSSS